MISLEKITNTPGRELVTNTVKSQLMDKMHIQRDAGMTVIAELKLPAIPYKRDLRFCSGKLRGMRSLFNSTL